MKITTIYDELRETFTILGKVIFDCYPKVDFENKALVFDSFDDIRVIYKKLEKVYDLKDEISKRVDVLNFILECERDE